MDVNRLTRGATKAERDAWIKDVCEGIQAELLENSVVRLPIGIFRIVERPARTGTNPRTKEKMVIGAKKVVKFSAAKWLREKLG
jgi:DNA-binding protein HU-beta